VAGLSLIVSSSVLPMFSGSVVAEEEGSVIFEAVPGWCAVELEELIEEEVANIPEEELVETEEEEVIDEQPPVSDSPPTEDSGSEEVENPVITEEETTETSESVVLVDEESVSESTTAEESVGPVSNEVLEPEEILTPDEMETEEVTEETVVEEIESQEAEVVEVEETEIEEESAEVEEEETETIEESETVISTEIENDNEADVCNNSEVVGNTGANEITSEEQVDNAGIDSGNVNVYANVLNIVNTNNINSQIVEITETFNNLSADILMNQPETTPAELGQDLVASLCQDIQCQSLTSFKLTNNNNAVVENNVDVVGNSGGNSITNAGQDTDITTGNVNALVNVINIVNANLINSRWTIATFNIFGNWEGDLVLPSELYFDGYTTFGSSAGVNVQQTNKIVLDITNENVADINNNVGSVSNTGGNAIDSEGTLQNAEIGTGDSVNAANVENIANVTLVNSNWFLNIVNTLGSWTGNIYSLPEQVEFEQTNLGMTFFSTSGADAASREQFENQVAELDTDNEVTIEIENSNNAVINNNVNVETNSGDNEITGENLERARIQTGYSRALTNIFNFANTNLVNSNLSVGLTNIFGSWNGNIVFGYPDLAVTQTLLQENVPSPNGSRVNYELQYSNLSGSSMKDAVLEWNFDTSIYDYSHSNIAGLYPIEDGLLRINLGKLSPLANGRVQVQLRTILNLEEDRIVETSSKIFGSGPEKNLVNNSHSLNAVVSGEFKDVPELPNPNPQPVQSASVQEYIPPVISNALFTKVSKTNDSNGRELKAGDTVKFTITIENNNSEKIYNAIMTDTLLGPDGTALTIDQQSLGELLPNENIVFEYSLEITADVEDGVYTNNFWIEGLDNRLQPTKTLVASSQFMVRKEVKLLEMPVSLITENTDDDESAPILARTSPTVTRTVVPVSEEMYFPPIVLSATTDKASAFNEPELPVSNGNRQLQFTLTLVALTALFYASYRALNRSWF